LLHHGCTHSGHKVMQVLNACGTSVWNLLPVTQLEPRILKWLKTYYIFLKLVYPGLNPHFTSFTSHLPACPLLHDLWQYIVLWTRSPPSVQYRCTLLAEYSCSHALVRWYRCLRHEHVNILGCQLPGILIATTVSTTFCFSQHLLLLCRCSTISKIAFTFPLMKHKTTSTVTLGAEKSAALDDFIHTQCVKQYLVHDLEKNKH
jgi:hypothetical protein